MTGRVIRSAADWAAVFRSRIAALGYSHFEVDQLAGLADGYTNKILNGRKQPGAVMIERLCKVLKITLVPQFDDERVKRSSEDCALGCVAAEANQEDSVANSRSNPMSRPLLNFRPEPEVAERIKQLAAADRRPVSQYLSLLVEDAIKARFERHETERTAA